MTPQVVHSAESGPPWQDWPNCWGGRRLLGGPTLTGPGSPRQIRISTMGFPLKALGAGGGFGQLKII